MSTSGAGAISSTRLRLVWLAWQVRICLALGCDDKALSVLDRMLVMKPGSVHALSSRAHVRATRGETDGAIVDLRAVLAIDGERAPDWFNLGYLLEQRGDTTEAEMAFRRAVRIDPTLDRAWYGLSLALIRQGRHDDAVDALEHNTALQPMSPYGWYQLARVHVDRRRPEEAIRIIRHLRGFEPKVAAQLERETGLSIAAGAGPGRAMNAPHAMQDRQQGLKEGTPCR